MIAGTVPITSAKNVLKAASYRINPEQLCDLIGLPFSSMGAPSARVPYKRVVALYETAAKLARDPAFGLHVAVQTHFRSFGAIAYVALNSACFGEAIQRIAYYFPIWTDSALFRLAKDKSRTTLSWEYVDSSIGESRHDCEMTLLTMAMLGRQQAGNFNNCPLEVHFQHAPPRDVSEYRRLFGAPVFFRMSTNQLIFDQPAIQSQFRDADDELCTVMLAHADHLLSAACIANSFVDQVKAALRCSLRSRDVGILTIGRAMGMSARSLQRKLTEQGTSFRELLNSLRRDLALAYLDDPEMPISEIAYNLGYAQTSEFQRAFKAWTDSSPRQYQYKVASNRRA